MKSKKTFVIYGVIAILVLMVLGWFGANYYLSYRVNAQAREIVDSMGLSEKIKWKSISASFGKTAKVKEVELNFPGILPKPIQIKELALTNFERVRKTFELDLVASDITDNTGKSYFYTLKDMYKELKGFHLRDIPPMDASLHIENSYIDDLISVQIDLEQEGGLNFDFNTNLKNINPFLEQVDKVLEPSSDEDTKKLSDAELQILLGSQLAIVQVVNSEIYIEDSGLIKNNRNDARNYMHRVHCPNILNSLEYRRPEQLCEPFHNFLLAREKDVNFSISPGGGFYVSKLLEYYPFDNFDNHTTGQLLRALQFKISNTTEIFNKYIIR